MIGPESKYCLSCTQLFVVQIESVVAGYYICEFYSDLWEIFPIHTISYFSKKGDLISYGL